MSGIRNLILVDVDSDREENIIVAHPDPSKIKGTDKPIIDDMACLCEAIVTLIHLADKQGIKRDFNSLKDCIKHLQDGFSDSSFKVKSKTNTTP